MPQITKGGKFIFGKSLIRQGGTIQLPTQAMKEYNITADTKIYLFTGSKKPTAFVSPEKISSNLHLSINKKISKREIPWLEKRSVLGRINILRCFASGLLIYLNIRYL